MILSVASRGLKCHQPGMMGGECRVVGGGVVHEPFSKPRQAERVLAQGRGVSNSLRTKAKGAKVSRAGTRRSKGRDAKEAGKVSASRIDRPEVKPCY